MTAPTLEPRNLSPSELALLREVRASDEDHGGLARHELTPEEADMCDALVASGHVEVVSEFGEAPDGEEDEREAGGTYAYRITGKGVAALRG
jgi:hypothetical protein